MQTLLRALAGAPRARVHAIRRPPRRWRIAAIIVPLAAAAAAVLWLTRPTPDPMQYAIEDLGVYTTPTDILLSAPGIDVVRSAPVLGCVNGGLACLIDDTGVEPQSLRVRREWRYA